MGCSWISVVSLAVLILGSFLANMRANTLAPLPQTTMKLDMATTEGTVTMAVDKQTNHEDATLNTGESNVNCSLQNITKEENSSATARCIDADTTPSSFRNDTLQTNTTRVITYKDFPEFKHYTLLHEYLVFAAGIPGFVTNTLIIFIAARIKPMHTCEMYMIALGIADLMAVSGRFVHRMLDRYGVRRHNFDCKSVRYIYTVGLVYSNLILMAWTLERFIAVMFPLKLSVWCSIRNTKITIGTLFVACALLSIPFFTDSAVMTFWSGIEYLRVCELTEFAYAVYTHIESIYYIYIPFLVIGGCNIAILYRLTAMSKARLAMASNQDTIDKKASENKRMTILLLSISVAFFVFHIPYIYAMVINYLYPNFTVLLAGDPHHFAKVIFSSSLAYALAEFQNCTNFFLYCLSGTKFRTMLMQTFCKCIPDKKTDKTQMSKTDTTKI